MNLYYEDELKKIRRMVLVYFLIGVVICLAYFIKYGQNYIVPILFGFGFNIYMCLLKWFFKKMRLQKKYRYAVREAYELKIRHR